MRASLLCYFWMSDIQKTKEKRIVPGHSTEVVFVSMKFEITAHQCMRLQKMLLSKH